MEDEEYIYNEVELLMQHILGKLDALCNIEEISVLNNAHNRTSSTIDFIHEVHIKIEPNIECLGDEFVEKEIDLEQLSSCVNKHTDCVHSPVIGINQEHKDENNESDNACVITAVERANRLLEPTVDLKLEPLLELQNDDILDIGMEVTPAANDNIADVETVSEASSVDNIVTRDEIEELINDMLDEVDLKVVQLRKLPYLTGNLVKKEDHHTVLKTFFCGKCNEQFSSIIIFLKHNLLTHNNLSFFCKLCDLRIFPYVGALLHHIMLQHNPKRFIEEEKKFSVIKAGVVGNEYYCDKCGDGFDKIFDFQKHYEKDHSTEIFQCQLCDYNYRHFYDLIRHFIVAHGKAANLECSICFRVLSQREYFVDHIFNHCDSITADIVCPFCKLVVTKVKYFKEHILRHLGKHYQCALCRVPFINANLVREHLYYVHLKAKSQIITCQVCKGKFHKEFFLEHRLEHIASGELFIITSATINEALLEKKTKNKIKKKTSSIEVSASSSAQEDVKTQSEEKVVSGSTGSTTSLSSPLEGLYDSPAPSLNNKRSTILQSPYRDSGRVRVSPRRLIHDRINGSISDKNLESALEYRDKKYVSESTSYRRKYPFEHRFESPQGYREKDYSSDSPSYKVRKSQNYYDDCVSKDQQDAGTSGKLRDEERLKRKKKDDESDYEESRKKRKQVDYIIKIPEEGDILDIMRKPKNHPNYQVSGEEEQRSEVKRKHLKKHKHHKEKHMEEKYEIYESSESIRNKTGAHHKLECKKKRSEKLKKEQEKRKNEDEMKKESGRKKKEDEWKKKEVQRKKKEDEKKTKLNPKLIEKCVTTGSKRKTFSDLITELNLFKSLPLALGQQPPPPPSLHIKEEASDDCVIVDQNVAYYNFTPAKSELIVPVADTCSAIPTSYSTVAPPLPPPLPPPPPPPESPPLPPLPPTELAESPSKQSYVKVEDMDISQSDSDADTTFFGHDCKDVESTTMKVAAKQEPCDLNIKEESEEGNLDECLEECLGDIENLLELAKEDQ